jgi:amino acid transporter
VISDGTADRIAAVEARSTAFRKELGLLDLVLIQILYVVGSAWVGAAAKLGTDHVVFWLLAAGLYYLPQAAVVIFLSRQLPLEGGLYQWATAALGRFAGFLVAWNLWAYGVVMLAGFGVVVANNLAYLAGPAVTFTSSPLYTPIVSGVTIVAILVVSLLGLGVGKWIQDAGGAGQLLTYAALILIPFVALWRGQIAAFHPLRTTVPSVTTFSLNIFGKMAVGAFSGFEYVAILAGECRSPSRTIGRSVSIAVPVIATMFILGTSSVLALVPESRIDLVSPIPQTLTIGFGGLGIVRLVVPALILLLVVRQLGNMTLLLAGTTRLPMVAGWDGLLPAWFARLHPRFRTPINSILFVGALTVALSLVGQAGVNVQESFQLLDNAAGIFYAFTYLGLFAIPLFGANRLPVTVPLWLRGAALAGFAVTALYSVLSIFPIIDVPSWQSFTAKIVIVLLGTNVLGVTIYARTRHSPSDPQRRLEHQS